MAQTIRLCLTYTSYCHEDIRLPNGLTWADVTDWWIKWDNLHLRTADGTLHTVSFDQSEMDPDLKHPTSVTICTADATETVLAEQ